MSGGIKLEHFLQPSMQDQAVRKLMSKIRVAPYTAKQFPLSNYFGSEVRIRLKDGRTLLGRVDEPVGCTSENSLPLSLLREKFIDCAKYVCSQERAEEAWKAGLSLESINNVRLFVNMFESDRPLAGACSDTGV